MKNKNFIYFIYIFLLGSQCKVNDYIEPIDSYYLNNFIIYANTFKKKQNYEENMLVPINMFMGSLELNDSTYFDSSNGTLLISKPYNSIYLYNLHKQMLTKKNTFLVNDINCNIASLVNSEIIGSCPYYVYKYSLLTKNIEIIINNHDNIYFKTEFYNIREKNYYYSEKNTQDNIEKFNILNIETKKKSELIKWEIKKKIKNSYNSFTYRIIPGNMQKYLGFIFNYNKTLNKVIIYSRTSFKKQKTFFVSKKYRIIDVYSNFLLLYYDKNLYLYNGKYNQIHNLKSTNFFFYPTLLNNYILLVKFSTIDIQFEFFLFDLEFKKQLPIKSGQPIIIHGKKFVPYMSNQLHDFVILWDDAKKDYFSITFNFGFILFPDAHNHDSLKPKK